jgi:magnesium-transporting ATPase (P-type)
MHTCFPLPAAASTLLSPVTLAAPPLDKKRSTAVVHQPDGSVRIYCKGASEWILKDCTHYLTPQGTETLLTEEKRVSLERYINSLAENALRTLCLAHRDYKRATDLPNGWIDNPPDNAQLCLDAIVGIIDPLRSDVKEAVRIAQQAGVTVRMVTGDNIATACAIARQHLCHPGPIAGL